MNYEKDALPGFAEAIGWQVSSIRESLDYLKSDVIVDDKAIESVFDSVCEIVRACNLLMAASDVPAIEYPEALPSYQEDSDD